MKWTVFALLGSVAAIIPSWLRGNPRRLPVIGFLVGFSPFFLGWPHLNMGLMTMDWPGYVDGLQVSILDFFAITLYIYFFPSRSKISILLLLPMAMYFVSTLLSILQSGAPIPSLFYCWQLLKMYFIFNTLARACEIPGFSAAVLKGLGVGVIVQAFAAGSQHFVLGVLQANGTFESQNQLGMVTNLVAIPFFALLLSGQTGWLAGAVVVAAVVVEISTTSRGTLGLGALGYSLVVVVSSLRQWTSRKTAILLLGAGVAIVAGVLATASLDRRTGAEMAGSDKERLIFETAAAMMLADHPFGVGANQYVAMANIGNYDANAGVIAGGDQRTAIVHNVYRLVAAETGYFGLFTFVVLLASGMLFVLSRGWRLIDDQRGDLLLGIGVSFCVLYLHSFFEWVFIQFHVQYIYCILLALAVGMSNQHGYLARWNTARPRPAVREVPAVPFASRMRGSVRSVLRVPAPNPKPDFQQAGDDVAF